MKHVLKFNNNKKLQSKIKYIFVKDEPVQFKSGNKEDNKAYEIIIN